MRLPSKESAALWLVIVVGSIAWAEILWHRRTLPRMWALLARKPHTTRRAHLTRQLVFQLELLWVLTPEGTAMVLAMGLATYLVEERHWPALIGVGLFLVTGCVVLVAYGIRHARVARRLGLRCPVCGVWLIHDRWFEVADSGRCPKCSTVVFGPASDTRDRVARKLQGR